ncbi:MAG: hypothetical protein KC457_20655, partial [Myxococcales bacterium]|nr:hypothetical protein [Myxococcales bacterium]
MACVGNSPSEGGDDVADTDSGESVDIGDSGDSGDSEIGTTTDSTTDTDADSSSSDTGTDTSDTGPMPDMGPPPTDPNEEIPPPDAEGCHAIYAQTQFPEFEIVIQEVVWEQLQYNWDNGEMLEDDPNADPKDYYPIEVFRYQH